VAVLVAWGVTPGTVRRAVREVVRRGTPEATRTAIIGAICRAACGSIRKMIRDATGRATRSAILSATGAVAPEATRGATRRITCGATCRAIRGTVRQAADLRVPVAQSACDSRLEQGTQLTSIRGCPHPFLDSGFWILNSRLSGLGCAAAGRQALVRTANSPHRDATRR
jgi:hypothetical protein